MTEPQKVYAKDVVVEPVQWFKNGDHPNDKVGEQVVDMMAFLSSIEPGSWDGVVPTDAPTYERLEGAVVRFFRRPEKEFSGELVHEECGYKWHNHGWLDTSLDGETVCPGDWVITDA